MTTKCLFKILDLITLNGDQVHFQNTQPNLKYEEGRLGTNVVNKNTILDECSTAVWCYMWDWEWMELDNLGWGEIWSTLQKFIPT